MQETEPCDGGLRKLFGRFLEQLLPRPNLLPVGISGPYVIVP